MVAVCRSLQSYMRKYSLPTVNTHGIKQQLATTENYNVLRNTWSLVNTCTSVQFESSVRKGLQLAAAAAADAMYNGVFCSLRNCATNRRPHCTCATVIKLTAFIQNEISYFFILGKLTEFMPTFFRGPVPARLHTVAFAKHNKMLSYRRETALQGAL